METDPWLNLAPLVTLVPQRVPHLSLVPRIMEETHTATQFSESFAWLANFACEACDPIPEGHEAPSPSAAAGTGKLFKQPKGCYVCPRAAIKGSRYCCQHKKAHEAIYRTASIYNRNNITSNKCVAILYCALHIGDIVCSLPLA